MVKDKYITDKTLLEEGFVKRANMYIGKGISVYLLKGHTWLAPSPKDKRNKDVRTIKDILDYVEFVNKFLK